jgi:hypothetical protein
VKCSPKKGTQYTLDIIPKGRTQRKHRYPHIFSAPSEPQEMQRVLFKPVKTE